MTLEEVIADALLHYVDPPVRTLWGAERSAHKALCILSALKIAGLVVVPEEPTEAMIEAGTANRDLGSPSAVYGGIYRAMIRAATSPDAPVPADPARRD